MGRSNERAVRSLTNGDLSIGRGPDNALVLNDDKLSRHHCVIRLRDDSVVEIEDLRSLNGTRVNGSRIRKRQVLQVGDTVSLGNTTLILEPEDSPLLDTQALASAGSQTGSQVAPATDADGGGTGDGDADETNPGARATPDQRSRTEVLAGFETEVPGLSPDGTGLLGGTSYGDASGSEPIPKAAAQRLAEENRVLRRVLEINKQLNSDLRVERLLAAIVDAAIQLTKAERGFLLLVDPMSSDGSANETRGDDAPPPPPGGGDPGTIKGEDLRIAVARNFERERIQNPKLSLSIPERVIRSRKAELVANAQHRGEVSEARSIQNLSIQSVLCVPLVVRSTTIGALYLDHRWQTEAFEDAALELVEAFADQAALALSNARMLETQGEQNQALARQRDRIEALHKELEERFHAQTRELQTVKSQLDPIGEETRTMAARFTEIIGSSAKLIEMLRTLDKVAASDSRVFIHGETGTGKELVARALHRHSRRANGPFVAINCKGFSETLLESELFGHVKGAFTGADRDKPGLFEEADGGTLLLDEIGDMPPSMQTKLLRVLEQSEFRRVGETGRMRTVDARILSASHRDIQEMIDEGSFREDLFYRLHQIRVEVPALRERRDDIPELLKHFLDGESRRYEIEPVPTIDATVMKALLNYHWPGNIRQLQGEVKRMITLRDGDTITVETLSREIADAANKPGVSGRSAAASSTGAGSDPENVQQLKDLVNDVEKAEIIKALKLFEGNKTKMAEALGLTRPGLRMKMQRLEIPDDPEAI